MAEKCAAPDCLNAATTGPLCYVCEKKWMHERREVIDEADHLTSLAAQFVAWCAAHNQPDPYHE